MASVSNYHIENIAGLFVIHVFHTLWLLDNHVTLWNAKQETGVKKHNTSVSHLNNKGRLLSLKRWRYSRLYNITIFKLLIFVNKVRMASAFGYIMLLNVVLIYLYSIFSQSAWDVWIIYILFKFCSIVFPSKKSEFLLRNATNKDVCHCLMLSKRLLFRVNKIHDYDDNDISDDFGDKMLCLRIFLNKS